MSFGFKVPKGGERWDGEKRTLYQIDLREVSIVQAWTAYPDTEVALRSARDAWLALPTPREIVRRRRLAIAEASTWAWLYASLPGRVIRHALRIARTACGERGW